MPSDNAQLIARFLVYLGRERQASENTVSNYEIDLTKLGEAFGKPFAKVERKHVRKYLSDSLALGLSSRTVARRLACLRSFYRFLLDEEEASSDPTRHMPIPKSTKTIPQSVSADEIEKMLSSIKPGRAHSDVRDRAMILTLYSSGLRVGELTALRMQDLDLEAGSAKVWNGKGGKDGIVPLGGRAITALNDFLKIRDSDSPYLFPGRRWPQLNRKSVYARIRKISNAALGRELSPHSMRRGFATALVDGGTDIRDVQALMRHAYIDTTALYICTDLKYLRKIYYASHPRSRVAAATR